MTVLKVYFKKKGPSGIQYRKYKNFSNNRFKNVLLNELITSKIGILRVDIFVNTVIKVFIKSAPVRQRYVKAIEAPFVKKVLNKAIIKRSQLRNVFLKKYHLKVKLPIINKRSFVPASYGNKNGTIL